MIFTKTNLFCAIILLLNTQLYGNETLAPIVIKKADDVFNKWNSWQHIMCDKEISTLRTNLNDSFLKTIKGSYEKNAAVLDSLKPFLQRLTGGHISEFGYSFRSPTSPILFENFAGIYDLVEHNMSEFVHVLRQSHFLAIENTTQSVAGTSHDAIEKYNALANLMFADVDEKVQGQNLFSVANRFYEYCFGENTFDEFRSILLNKQQYPLARFLYAITWLNLAGNGWKHWHEDSLKTLKQRFEAGHKIVYIAGGSDLLQMLKAGIYNIKNIDPQLPSQPKYYADDWYFLVRGQGVNGGIGDKIVFNFDNNIITMERTAFRDLGTTFKARIATGDVIELPHSITTWTILDAQNNKLGEYVLERRFCEQTDFEQKENTTMLMSFNELYFIALPSILHGWNIDPSRFSDNLSIVVKQLRKPVSKQMMVNMRVATLLNATDFKFIALGTCIN